jgi:hypothetical protein
MNTELTTPESAAAARLGKKPGSFNKLAVKWKDEVCLFIEAHPEIKNPLQIILEIANDPKASPLTRGKMAVEFSKFVYPQLTAVEVSEPDTAVIEEVHQLKTSLRKILHKED